MLYLYFINCLIIIVEYLISLSLQYEYPCAYIFVAYVQIFLWTK